MKRKKLIGRLYPLYLAAIFMTMITMIWFTAAGSNHFAAMQDVDLIKAQAKTIERVVGPHISASNGPEIDAKLKTVGTAFPGRITIAVEGGVVIADSRENPAKIGAFKARSEVKSALDGETGVMVRESIAYDERMLYVAVPLQTAEGGRGLIRIATPLPTTTGLLRQVAKEIVPVFCVVFLFAAMITLYTLHRVNSGIGELKHGAKQFADGNLEYRLPISDTAEFASFAESLNAMAARLHAGIRRITEQRNELEAVLSSMMEAVIVIDNNEKIISVNQAAERLFGIDLRTVKGRNLQEAVRNTELNRFVLKTLSSTESLEGEIMFIGDPEKHLQAHGAALMDEQNNKIGVLVVFNDVTRLKTLENVRRDFVANVSHELKTPITSIKGFLETLKEGAVNDPENAERFLDIIIKHTDRLNSIIDDLLTLSRIERDTEKGEIALEPGHIETVIASVAKSCELKAKLKEIDLRYETDDGMTAMINPVLLEQALVNLVDNAIKYSDRGRTVRIEARKVGPEAVIRVIDQGCGIPKEHLTRIFERFYRVDKARSRKVGGTGLGLSIVKHIANAHHGRIMVESSPTSGSVFTLYVPLHATGDVKEA
jgi:two-component system, OmpR family, phosphate regulon sensor histidine kinase PhoR